MSGSHHFGRGQAAAGLPLLRTYRDLLTEQFLGGNTMERLLGVPRRQSMSFLARQTEAAPEPALDYGVTGFGVGGQDGPPRLVVFADRHTEATSGLQSRLHDAAVPATLITGVRFLAAGARPVRGGDSIGYGAPGGASGTLGCVVKPRQGNGRYGLTCNHVIADLNRAAVRADDIWAPGTVRGGGKADRLGLLHDFAAIDFTAGHSNVIDAALAEPGSAADLDPAIAGVGAVAGINAAPAFGTKMQKSGAVTGHSVGYYWYQINAQVAYAGGQTALFRDMLGIVGAAGDFANQGDSGALVLDDARQAAGLLISVASGINLSLATAIMPVLDHFDVDIV
jgi:hypothetical protein